MFKLEIVLLLVVLLSACLHVSDGQSFGKCGCHVDSCVEPDGQQVSNYYSKHYLCSLHHTRIGTWEGCACPPRNHLDVPSLCRCDNITSNCYDRTRNCYYPSTCIPCAGKRCKSPRDNCDWYSDCLNWQFPHCTGKNDYALNYGLKYCNKYVKNMYLFSDEGKRWITSVRICLQDKLIDQLSADPQPSCVELKDFAFATHEECYTNPGGGNSICQLGCPDLLATMLTVAGGFFQEFRKTLEQSLGVTGTCVRSGASQGFKDCLYGVVSVVGAVSPWPKIFRAIQFTIWLANREKRSISCDEICMAERSTESIFNSMNLPVNNSIEWFALPKTSGDKLEVTVLLSDRSFLNVSTNISTSVDPSAALDSAVEKFRSVALSQGEVTVNGQVLRISQVSTCGNLECTEKNSTKVQEDAGARATRNSGSTSFFFICFAVFIVY